MSVVTKEMLDAAVDVGRNQERERIIKLLEQDYFHDIEFESITLRAGMEPQFIKKHGANCLACPAIALIKGENK